MSLADSVRKYQQQCFSKYSASVGLPEDYVYPSGNPIRPVPPIQTKTHGLMIIGAYPSARFESRLSSVSRRRRLIPVADNLQPFGEETYFDGTIVRRLESAAGLKTYLLDPLGLKLPDCWITDLVKVFLYKDEHADSCADAVPGFVAPVLRPSFRAIGSRSLPWIQMECDICQPKVIMTLSEDVARVISGSRVSADRLLVTEPSRPDALGGRLTFYCPHPDGCRRHAKWRERMSAIVREVKQHLE